jgi:hypothetical protein
MPALRVLRWLFAAALAAVPVAASATPVTYDFVSGTVTVTALLSPSTLVLLNGSPSVTVDLSGTSFTFDTALVPVSGEDMSISSFTFVTEPSPVLNLTPAVGAVTQVSFGPLTITTGTGFTSGATGTGPYAFAMGPIDVSGTATNNLGGPTPFLVSTPGAVGVISLGTGTLSLEGITLGAITTEGGTLLVIGDIEFHGMVPEPPTLLMMALGVVGLAFVGRRRAR